MVVTMSLDGSVHRIGRDREGGREGDMVTLSGHQSPVAYLCADGDTLYSSDSDGNVIVHNHPMYP